MELIIIDKFLEFLKTSYNVFKFILFFKILLIFYFSIFIFKFLKFIYKKSKIIIYLSYLSTKFTIYSAIQLLIEFSKKITLLIFSEKLYDDESIENDLSDKICLFVGGNGTIGLEAIKQLLKKNCFVIITLNKEKNLTLDQIKLEVKEKLKNFDSKLYRFEYLDFTCLQSVLDLVDKLILENKNIDFVVNNAGVALDNFNVTEDGFESQFSINFLGPTLLTLSLLSFLENKNTKKVTKFVFTNSCVHKFCNLNLDLIDKAVKKNFFTHDIYCQTKLFQLLFNLFLYEDILKENNLDSNIFFYNIHPGIVKSGLFRNSWLFKYFKILYNFLGLFMKSPIEGAKRLTIPLISNELFFNSPGINYYEDFQISKMNEICYEKNNQKLVFANTIKLLKPYLVHANKSSILKKYLD